ncbi:MAG: acyl-CoA thioesterase II [Desulfobacteraceae bacterium]
MAVCVQGDVLEELLRLLELEEIEENIFRGQSQDLGFKNVFGGQVLGQALSAASYTVPPERSAHSLHAYFLRPGDATRPIVYTVENMRDGKSFSTRRVKAIQKGQPIFSMAVSFQREETGFEHQDTMPEVPGPDGIASEKEMVQKLADRIPPGIRENILCVIPIEMRIVSPVDPFQPEKKPPQKYVWFRTVNPLPDDAATHRYMLAYASDFNLVTTSLYPHGHTFWESKMQVASLDHAMWFHRPFRMDQWMLYAIESPSASQARGMSIGRIFTREGQLVATVAQEGLIRYYGNKD